jgi:hypothetical protein
MPNIPHSPPQDGPAVTDTDLEALLAGHRDVAPWLRPVADVLAALSTEPSHGELTGEARAVAEFRRRTGVPVPRRRARRGTAGLRTKAAAGAAATAVILGGAATAAFADVLPAPIQRFAHEAIGAPYRPPALQPGRGHGKTAAPGQFASHGQPKASAKPHSTGGHPNRPGQEKPGTDQGQPGDGQGQQGNGQGQPGNGPGQQGNGQGQPGVGPGQQGNGQGNPHAPGQYGDPRPQWQQGNPHPQATQAASHGRPARHRPAVAT